MAERTLKDYRYHVEQFFTMTGSDLEPACLKLAVMRYFADSAQLSPSTFNTRRKSLKPFFEWTVSESILPTNPIDAIKKRKEDLKPRSVQAETVQRLLSLPDQKTFTGLRDYALLLLTMDSGIRPSEAFHLTVNDFNLRGGELLIPAAVAKTRVSRTLPLSPVTVDAVRRLIMVRPAAWDKEGVVFCSEWGLPLNSFTWGRRLQKYSKKLGTKVRPYALRHTFALLFLRQGGNAFALQKALGHTDLTMTKRYVALTESDLWEQHAKATPLNALLPSKRRVRKVE